MASVSARYIQNVISIVSLPMTKYCLWGWYSASSLLLSMTSCSSDTATYFTSGSGRICTARVLPLSKNSPFCMHVFLVHSSTLTRGFTVLTRWFMVNMLRRKVISLMGEGGCRFWTLCICAIIYTSKHHKSLSSISRSSNSSLPMNWFFLLEVLPNPLRKLSSSSKSMSYFFGAFFTFFWPLVGFLTYTLGGDTGPL